MDFETFKSLNSAIPDITNLLGVKLSPSSAMELFEEVDDEKWVYEVYEHIANVSIVLKIDWKVKEVISSKMLLINFF